LSGKLLMNLRNPTVVMEDLDLQEKFRERQKWI